MRTATINLRIDPHAKHEATLLYKSLGLTMSDAINLFINQSICENAIPFKIKKPNAETLEAMKELDEGKGIKVTMDDLRKIWNDAKTNNNDKEIPS